MTHKHVYSFKCVHRLSSYGLMIYASAFIIIFMPTSTKPQAGKLGQTYKIMVATAISVR